MNSYGPFTVALPIAPGVAAEQKIDSAAAKVVFMNMSPYTLYVNMNDGKNANKKILPFVQDIVAVGSQFNGDIDYLAAPDIGNINSSQAPSTILYIESFGPTEPVPGVYPSALPLLTVVGNSILIANQVIQTGQVVPTPAVEATPNPSFASAPSLPEAVINNDGSFTLGNVGTTLANQGKAFGHDGTGILTARQYAIGGPIANMPAVSFLGLSPIQLQSGAQETGFCGVDGQASAANQFIGVGVNFKTMTANTPTSITLSAVLHSNDQATSAGTISKIGFALTTESVAGGRVFTYDTYTTVGN